MATSTYKQQQPNKQPNKQPMPSGSGYPVTGTKTSGIQTRGNGAATKGKTARGPMA